MLIEHVKDTAERSAIGGLGHGLQIDSGISPRRIVEPQRTPRRLFPLGLEIRRQRRPHVKGTRS